MKVDEVPFPKCCPQECFIKIDATSVNRADIERKGNYPSPYEVANIIGLECTDYISNTN